MAVKDDKIYIGSMHPKTAIDGIAAPSGRSFSKRLRRNPPRSKRLTDTTRNNSRQTKRSSSGRSKISTLVKRAPREVFYSALAADAQAFVDIVGK
jgi:hypothetical protein